jgi:hypothetical protein
MEALHPFPWVKLSMATFADLCATRTTAAGKAKPAKATFFSKHHMALEENVT